MLVKMMPRRDYQKHFLAGFIIAIIFTVLFNPFWGVFMGNLAGIAKEVVWDKGLKKGTFEWEDMAYTGWGACFSVLIWGL